MKQDYREYHFTGKEIVKYLIQSILLCGTLDYLFYQNKWLMILAIPVSVIFLKVRKKQLIRERRKNLNYQFKDALNALSVAVQAGFSVENADKQLSEITCHAKGIFHLVPSARTIIDIGGQDAKAIQLDAKGNIQKFVMNDTGRFLDVMSRVLKVPQKQKGKVHFQAKEWAQVSSTCTVFAESEVISQLSKGLPRESIVAGVHQSVASKACSLAYRIGDKNDQVMC